MKRVRSSFRRPLPLLCLPVLVAAGCALPFIRGLEEQKAIVDSAAVIRGSVATEVEAEGTIVVFLVRLGDAPSLVDHFVLERPGSFHFVVFEGNYRIGAFQDLDANGLYEGEPVAWASGKSSLHADPGERIEDIRLLIPQHGRIDLDGPVDLEKLQARSLLDQAHRTVGQMTHAGEVAPLDAERFSRKNANRGLWRRADFTLHLGLGLFWLEACDPARLPVIFVHGMKGTPAEFKDLAQSLDPERFQPWFYQYPSGANLSLISKHLSQLVTQVNLRCKIEAVAFVAHSMGGLVTRGAILDHWDRVGHWGVVGFLAIATPWGGMDAARWLESAPEHARAIMPPAFANVATGSDFIDGLFFVEGGARRRLPPHVRFEMVLGYQRNGGRLGPSGDHVVPMRSAARAEPLEEAAKVYPLDETHTSLLRSAQTRAILRQILDEGQASGSPRGATAAW